MYDGAIISVRTKVLICGCGHITFFAIMNIADVVM